MPQGLQPSICWAQDIPLMDVCGDQGRPFVERGNLSCSSAALLQGNTAEPEVSRLLPHSCGGSFFQAPLAANRPFECRATCLEH